MRQAMWCRALFFALKIAPKKAWAKSAISVSLQVALGQQEGKQHDDGRQMAVAEVSNKMTMLIWCWDKKNTWVFISQSIRPIR